jgi:hypothetical protein
MSGRSTTFLVAEEFRPLLEAKGLDSFEAIMARSGGTIVRSVPGRSTVRLEIGRVVYLKRYEPAYYAIWQRLTGIHDEARHEWEMIHTLRAHGFRTAAPVACGRQGLRSFLITAEIEGGVPADEQMRRLNPRQRRRLVVDLAELTRRFHGAGFIYKDYYLSHIFVAGGELYLIDLQRVVGPRAFRRRWLIKDLGTACYSAELAGATRADLMKAYKVCFPTKRLAESDKRLICKILRRAARLHSRSPKYDVIWDASSR